MPRPSLFAVVSVFLVTLCLAAFAQIHWNWIGVQTAPVATLPGLEMQRVDGGSYNLTILVPDSFGRKYYSKPARIDAPFYISRHEITIDQWDRCVAAGGCDNPARRRSYQTGDHPVTLVSWFDAYRFTQWLSETTGETYRLPTEEEWAYAAFTGADVTRDTIDDLILDRQMIQAANMSPFRKTEVVGANGQNDWSIADTTGSVWEWTLTCWFSSDEENRRPRTIAQLSNPELCPNRIVQGDERAHVPFFVDKVYAGGCGTGSPVDHIGFRVVREAGMLERLL